MRSDLANLPSAIFSFSQLVAKVSCIDLLRRDVVRSLFFDDLRDFMHSAFSEYAIQEKAIPTADRQLIVDYLLPSKRPFYLFGVNEDAKASRVVISCLNFQKANLPFRSVIVHESPDALSRFNRNQLMNAADKQFSSLDDFRQDGKNYILRETA
jgi:hypothetical protein